MKLHSLLTRKESPLHDSASRLCRRSGVRLRFLTWAAGFGASCGLWLFAQAAQAGCDDFYLQYKVASAGLDKCGTFLEYTNLDLPRIHVYHRQVTHET